MLVALLVPESVVLLDAAELESVAEPETEPEVEPDTEPEALMLVLLLELSAGAVVAALDVAWSVLVDWLAEVLVDVSDSLVEVLLLTSPEQPAPRVSAAASNAVAPIKLRLVFFIFIASIVVQETAAHGLGAILHRFRWQRSCALSPPPNAASDVFGCAAFPPTTHSSGSR